MSTRSYIAMKTKGPTFKVIYCHWDGYPSNNGKILLNHYKTPKQVNALLKLGDLSSLGETLGKKRDFDGAQPEDGCVAYGRDRGEKGTEAKTFNFVEMEKNPLIPKSFQDKELSGTWCEYLYVFDEATSEWYFSRCSGTPKLKKLTLNDCEE